jgi:molecular chaperone HscB
LKLQRLLHPDNFSLASEETKGSSARWSSFLNKAYETLKDPQKRAVHLYQLRSGKSFDEEATLDATTSVNDLGEMLQDILGIRMELEECQDPGQARDILNENAERVSLVYQDLERAFNRNDWDKAKALLIELRYLKSIETVGRDILAELEKEL